MKIIDLFARIGVKTDGDKLKTFLGNVDGARLGLIGAAGAAVGAAIAIQRFTRNALDGAAAIKQLQSETGASAEELQKWRSVATQVNVSAQSVDNAIRSIAANQERIKFGEGNISGFQLLGIDPRQDPFDILDELRRKTQGMSAGMRKNLAAQMGLGPDIIQILELTNDQFDRMANRAFVIPQSAINGMDRARAAIGQVKDGITFLYTSVVAELAPEMADMSEAFSDFIRAHKDTFVRVLKEGFQILSSFISAVRNSAFMIDTAVKKTIGWKKAIGAITAAFVLMNSTILLSPIGLLVAGIILLVAVMDDLYGYTQGRRSLFGEFAKQFPGLEDKFNSFIDKAREAGEVIKTLLSGDAMAIDDMLESWGRWGEIIKDISENVSDLIDFLSNLTSKSKVFIRDVGDWFGRTFGGGEGATTPAPVSQGQFAPGGSITGDTANSIYIFTKDDPKEIADQTGRAVERASNQRRRDR